MFSWIYPNNWPKASQWFAQIIVIIRKTITMLLEKGEKCLPKLFFSLLNDLF